MIVAGPTTDDVLKISSNGAKYLRDRQSCAAVELFELHKRKSGEIDMMKATLVLVSRLCLSKHLLQEPTAEGLTPTSFFLHGCQGCRSPVKWVGAELTLIHKKTILSLKKCCLFKATSFDF